MYSQTEGLVTSMYTWLHPILVRVTKTESKTFAMKIKNYRRTRLRIYGYNSLDQIKVMSVAKLSLIKHS